MIPKKVNYIWLGKGKKSSLSNICIDTWYRVLTDYEIIEWNEDNLDLDSLSKENRFFAECRKRKLWSYMADYIRLYILYNYGGIYFDTDIQVLKPLNDLLDNSILLGYEAYGVYLGTGVMASEPKHPAIKAMLDFYDQDIWNEKVYTIPEVLDCVIKKNPEIFADIYIYPKDFFGPYDYHKEYSREIITPNTYTIHWYDGTWKNNKQVGVFLQTKHIKNPLFRAVYKLKKLLGYYKRKIF